MFIMFRSLDNMHGQHVFVDVFILVSASIYTLFGVVHIILLWRARNSFFIALRSPLLACVSGSCVTLRYISCTFYLVLEGRSHADNLNLVTLPAIWVAQAAVVFMAARLLVMYDPVKRFKYGRYTNEKHLFRCLMCLYVLVEISWWALVLWTGKSTVAGVVGSSALLPSVLTIAAATFLGWHLRSVDDLSNMARDVRLVVLVMGIAFPVNVVTTSLLHPDSLEMKYVMIAFFAFSHTPIVWILNIRPVREILFVEHRRASMCPFRGMLSMSNNRVAVAKDDNTGIHYRRRASCTDSARLEVVMAMDSLRTAFGSFCHKSLCGESFQFLEDVSYFKRETLIEAERSEKRFKGFGGYVAIVNDYIADGSHSEVNIDSRTKQDILSFRKFEVYSSLDLDERMRIFSAAENGILKILADNLLNSFILSAQYKAVVGV